MTENISEPIVKWTLCPKCGARGDLPKAQYDKVDKEALIKLAAKGRLVLLKGGEKTLLRTCYGCHQLEKDGRR